MGQAAWGGWGGWGGGWGGWGSGQQDGDALPKATTTNPPAKVPPPARASGDGSGASKDGGRDGGQDGGHARDQAGAQDEQGSAQAGGLGSTVAISLEERVRTLEQQVAKLELLLAEALRDRLANPSQDVQDVVLKPAEDGINFVRSCTLEGRCFHCGRSKKAWARTRIPLWQHVWQSHQSETLGSDWQDVAKLQCMTRKVCVPNASGSGVISCLCLVPARFSRFEEAFNFKHPHVPMEWWGMRP